MNIRLRCARSGLCSDRAVLIIYSYFPDRRQCNSGANESGGREMLKSLQNCLGLRQVASPGFGMIVLYVTILASPVSTVTARGRSWRRMNPIAVENKASPSRKDARMCEEGGARTQYGRVWTLLPHPHTQPSAMEGCLGGVRGTRRWLQ
jgi:hypothetical protein